MLRRKEVVSESHVLFEVGSRLRHIMAFQARAAERAEALAGHTFPVRYTKNLLCDRVRIHTLVVFITYSRYQLRPRAACFFVEVIDFPWLAVRHSGLFPFGNVGSIGFFFKSFTGEVTEAKQQPKKKLLQTRFLHQYKNVFN